MMDAKNTIRIERFRHNYTLSSNNSALNLQNVHVITRFNVNVF